MNTHSVPACDGAAATALASTWARLREHSLRQLLVVGGLCLGIALLLTVLQGRGFGKNLLYSTSIGAFCTVIVAVVRLGVAALWDRRQRSRPASNPDAYSGWSGAIVGALLAMVLGPFLGLSLGDWLTGNRSSSLLNWGSINTRVTLLLAVLGTVTTLAIISSIERLHMARMRAEAAQRLAAETQLRLLQSQLEPHMLFNTLANLRVLIGLEPARAQEMLDHLIKFLRATLSASRSASHPLATEFDRIADYLALMAVRMGPRLQVQLELPADLRDVPVPPLLLQPLVENAIKHGLEPQVAGGCIELNAQRLGERLQVTVRDTGVGLEAASAAAAAQVPGAAGSHFGLEQVRQRLATLHGPAARLQMLAPDDARGGTLVVLEMPMQMPAPQQQQQPQQQPQAQAQAKATAPAAAPLDHKPT